MQFMRGTGVEIIQPDWVTEMIALCTNEEDDGEEGHYEENQEEDTQGHHDVVSSPLRRSVRETQAAAASFQCLSLLPLLHTCMPNGNAYLL
mmetsp:Transcript_5861/g.7240  ORF Transcript_5861/g.7240 Transcript_5861/m.7240 type:complete len:91 (-) Transcript_5861:661-933(-)